MGYEKGKFVTEAAAPIDVYRGIRYAMWKLHRNMWGRLEKKEVSLNRNFVTKRVC